VKLSTYIASLGPEGIEMALVGTDLLETKSAISGLRESFAAHGLFLGIAVFYLLAFNIAGLFVPEIAEGNSLGTFFGILAFAVLAAVFSMLIIQFYFVAAVDRSEKPLRDLFRRMKAVLKHRSTLMRGFPMFVALTIFMYAFTLFKASIPRFIPFSWDATFEQLDRGIHFGIAPWEILQPVFGNVVGTLILNLNYNLWFIVMQVFLLFFAFIQKPGLERSRFYVSFFLICSVCGSLMAILFSSAGPCYFGLVVEGDNPYATLMQYLRDLNAIIPVWAVGTQDMLWDLKAQGSVMGGISAMPSVHNGTALLFVLATWNGPKLLRNILIAHMILIFLGSIHLGWHYAVDAYAAWAITLVLWPTAYYIAKWWEARPKVQAFNAQYRDTL
jgi:PAP2 superfamily